MQHSLANFIIQWLIVSFPLDAVLATTGNDQVMNLSNWHPWQMINHIVVADHTACGSELVVSVNIQFHPFRCCRRS